ncbi:MAG: hypothetical protein MR321_06085 [Bacteroides sp.]|nr:hypothetical protein [Bacteroides sp.]
MTREIKKLLFRLRVEYALFWVLAFLLVVSYELEWLPQGTLAGDAQAEYVVQISCVLLSIVLIPLSLRLFNLSLTRYVRTLPLVEAIQSYRRWSEIRLSLLLAPVLWDLSAYYWTLDTTGLLCAGMVFVAAMFCVPGQGRLLSEMNLEEQE